MLTSIGFDAMTLANNHIMDYGAAGLRDTLALCRAADIRTVGVGEDLAASTQPLLLDVGELRLAVVNAAESEFGRAGPGRMGFRPLDVVDQYRQIGKLCGEGRVVLVVVHGGHEFARLPSPETVKRLRFLAEAGATAVLSHHAHRILPVEVHRGTPIFYGLGNFLFDWPSPRPPCWYEGAVAESSL